MSTLLRSLLLTLEDIDRICTAAVIAYPAECCGLLAGTVDESCKKCLVTRVVPAGNLLATEWNNSFEIDPATRFALMRYLRGGSERIIGHYHSHPDGPAYPSVVDLAMVFEPELVWVIIAVNNGQVRAVKGYSLDNVTVNRVLITALRPEGNA